MTPTPDPQQSDPVAQHVVVERVGDLLRLTLNRTPALNALTAPMVRAITRALEGHEGRIAGVVLDSSHPKAFCAGGDIRAIRENSLAGAHAESHTFFAEEYALNARIASYPHPFISLIDGVCMGGGMGLAIHGSVRIVTANAVMAMPETAIGFFPDVGASYFLSRLPGALGMYWGLTGARISPGDARYSGLATHSVGEMTSQELIDRLRNRGARTIDETLAELAGGAPASGVAAHRDRIDEVFGADSVDEISARLAVEPGDWAAHARALLAAVSPQSLAITHALLRWGSGADLAACLAAELGLADAVTRTPDFAEGVRAVLVDKDRNPQWAPVRFAGLDQAGQAMWDAPSS